MRNDRLWAWLVLGVLFLLSAGALWLTLGLKFDYNFENFFPKDNRETQFYKSFRSDFETDNDFLVVALERSEGVFDPGFLEKVQNLADDIATHPDVVSVLSITQIEEPLKGGFKKPILRYQDPELLALDAKRLNLHPGIIGHLVSPDFRSLALQIKHRQYLPKQASDSLAMWMHETLARHPFEASHMLGRAVGQKYYIDMMKGELVLFMGLSIALTVLFLFFAFRSFWGIWVPMAVVLFTIVWVMAIMQISGKAIDLMLMIMPSILFVVGMSDLVHIINKYLEALRGGLSKIPALRRAFKEVGWATLLTSVTTAIGFLTLTTSTIVPIVDFGIYTAIGVFVALFLAYSLLPAVLILNKTPKRVLQNQNQLKWNSTLQSLFRWSLKHPRYIALATVFLTALSIWGISKIDRNSYVLEDVGAKDPLRQEFNFFETHFSGVRPFELALFLEDSTSAFDRDLLLQLDRLDQYLKNDYGVKSILSPPVLIKTANRYYRNDPNEYRIPDTQEDIDKLLRWSKRFQGREIMARCVNAPKKLIRISGRCADTGSLYYEEQNQKLEAFMSVLNSQQIKQHRITGTATLMDLNNQYLSDNMINGLLIAFGAVSLLMGILFKSLRMVVIALIPNLLPLLLIGGIMGFFGIHLKASTAIVFTIAFGIAVDDSIHFLSKFRILLKEGYSVPYAVKRSFISTGKAIVLTSLILCGGFLILIFSDFMATFYVGLLISLTLVLAVLADLLLLPLLIFWLFKKKKATGLPE